MTISQLIGPPPTEGDPFPEIRSGTLGVRIARNAAEVDAGQALRYRVFFEERGATAPPELTSSRRDRDRFDPHADHLLVIDHALGSGADSVVGTYRLLGEQAAARAGGFYTSAEFDLSPLASFPGQKLELGRSCVAAGYRNRAVMQLLWRGIAAYVFANHIDIMFGCASLPGTDPHALATELTYLYHAHLAPPALRLRAVPDRRVDMRLLPPEAIDQRRISANLPPLIKGYLRLGGFIGDGAVIDHDFNTTDVAIVVKSDLITDKYYRHYERQLRDALE
jgi:putative hemolysin